MSLGNQVQGQVEWHDPVCVGGRISQLQCGGCHAGKQDCRWGGQLGGWRLGERQGGDTGLNEGHDGRDGDGGDTFEGCWRVSLTRS